MQGLGAIDKGMRKHRSVKRILGVDLFLVDRSRIPASSDDSERK